MAPWLTPRPENIIAATQELGIQIAEDQANGGALGGYFCPHNLDPTQITRSSAEEAYYQTAVTRRNFHLIPSSRVTRIQTTNGTEGPTVSAVEVSQDGGPGRDVS